MATGSEMSAISSSPDDPVIRILLMGRRGSGKSSSGNTILRERKFKLKRQEAEVCDAEAKVGEKRVAVTDCPDLLDPDLNKEKLEMMKEQLVSQCSAGLSAVLLTVPLEKSLENEEEILDFIKRLFGPEVQKCIMILFTCEDELEALDEPETIDEHLQKHEDLQRLVTECGGRFHCFNNRSKSDHQVQELLQKIEGMMEENGGKFIMERMKRSESKDIAINSISCSPDDPVIRILLMGRSGSGKSSSGNTILGERKFKVIIHKKKHEADVCEEATQIGGKQVQVINTPDLLDPDLSKEKLEELKQQLVSRCSTGLSAVLLTVPLEEPVENEEEILYYIKCLFGPEVQKYIMILFTHGDDLEDLEETIDEHLQNKDNADLQQLVSECGGKFHCFNNKKESEDQTQELLQKIERMMMENRGKFIMERMRRHDSMDPPDVNFSGESPSEDPDEVPVIPERKDLRLVLLGKTGCGKSATANTIIGRNLFKSTTSTVSQTKECQSETRVRFGQQISVIDTPGLYDTKLSEEEVTKEIMKCVTFASPGPHAFIIVIKASRFTEENKKTIEKLQEMSGEEIIKRTMILFTHKDDLVKDNKHIEQLLEESGPELQSLIHSCGNRYFCLDNNSASFPQFKDLLSNIEKMVADNGGMHFTNDMTNKIEKHIQKITKEKLDEKWEQYKQQHKQVPQTDSKKIYRRSAVECRRDAQNIIVGKINVISNHHLHNFTRFRFTGVMLFSVWLAIILALMAVLLMILIRI